MHKKMKKLIGYSNRNLIFLLLIVCLPVVANQLNSDLSTIQTSLEKWVETKKLISQETQNSKEQLALLEDRISLMQDRVASVRKDIEETQKNIEAANVKSDSLDAENETFKNSLYILETRILRLEENTLILLKGSPEPIQKKVESLSQQIPENPAQSQLPLSIRYQNLIGVLNALNNFNNEITVTTEVRDLQDSQSVEVKVMYLGLGQAYFSNKDGTIGGVGYPTRDGWEWVRQDEIASTVSASIAQHLDEKPADYEALPVTIINFKDDK